MADQKGRAKSRRTLVRLGVALGLLVVLVVAGRLLVPADAVRDLVAARLSEAMGRPVTVAAARGGILPRPWIELGGLAAAEGADGIALDVEALRLRLRWGPLLKREVEIDRAEIVRPTLAVRLVGAAGDTAGAATGGAPPAAAPATAPVSVRIEQLLISDGSVTVARADGAPVAQLRGLAEELSLLATTGGDLVVVGTTRLDTLRLFLPAGTLGEGVPITWTKDLRWEAAAGRLKVITSELALGALPVAVTGEVAGLAAGRPVADLRLAGGPARLETLQGYVPSGLAPQLDGVRSAGTASLEAVIRGPLGAAPDSTLDWSLRFALSDGSIAHPQLDSPLRDIAMVVNAGPGLVTIDNLAARTERSRFALRGEVTDYLVDPAYRLTIDLDLDLAEAMALQPPREGAPTVSGRAAAQVTAAGRAADPATLRLVGPLSLADVAVSGPDMALPVTDLQARGRIDGRVLNLENLHLRQGRSDYRVSGTVTDPLALMPVPLPGAPDFATVAVRFSSTLLDVDEILAAGQAAKAKGRAAAAAAGQGGAPAPPPPPPVALEYLGRVVGRAEAQIGTLVMRGNKLTEVAGVARGDRGRITLESTTARAYGGLATLAGEVDLADPRRGRLDLRLGVKGARAEQYFAENTAAGRFTRLASALVGSIDLTASLAGALDDTMGLDLKTLTSLGEVAVHDAKLTGLPLQSRLVALLDAPQLDTMAFKDLLQPFRIENGRLTVDKLQAKAGPVTLRASGWQSLDGEIAGRLDLTLPPEYAQGLRRQLPAQMADLLLDAEGSALVLPVSVSGRANDPSVRLDTEKLASVAAARAEAKLARETDKLKQQAIKEAQRGLQDLLKLPADTSGTGADSTRAPTLQDAGKSLLDRLKKGKKGGG